MQLAGALRSQSPRCSKSRLCERKDQRIVAGVQPNSRHIHVLGYVAVNGPSMRSIARAKLGRPSGRTSLRVKAFFNTGPKKSASSQAPADTKKVRGVNGGGERREGRPRPWMAPASWDSRRLRRCSAAFSSRRRALLPLQRNA